MIAIADNSGSESAKAGSGDSASPVDYPPLRKMTLLVVEDDDNLRNVLKIGLTREGWNLMTARNGDEALARCREMRPDIVITDIIMPEKDGFETIGELRRHWRPVKIIAMSGGGRMDPADYLRMAIAFGADTALIKPFSLAQMTDAISRVMVRRNPGSR